jgi:hypothetical protein
MGSSIVEPRNYPRRELNAGLAGGRLPSQAQFEYPATFAFFGNGVIGPSFVRREKMSRPNDEDYSA